VFLAPLVSVALVIVGRPHWWLRATRRVPMALQHRGHGSYALEALGEQGALLVAR